MLLYQWAYVTQNKDIWRHGSNVPHINVYNICRWVASFLLLLAVVGLGATGVSTSPWWQNGMEHWWNDNWQRKIQGFGGNPALVLLCSVQVQHGPPWPSTAKHWWPSGGMTSCCLHSPEQNPPVQSEDEGTEGSSNKYHPPKKDTTKVLHHLWGQRHPVSGSNMLHIRHSRHQAIYTRVVHIIQTAHGCIAWNTCSSLTLGWRGWHWECYIMTGGLSIVAEIISLWMRWQSDSNREIKISTVHCI
jgi:hypothetical protein